MTASKVFDWSYFAALVQRAQMGTRLRQHDNIHTSFMEPVQRLFNGIEPDSYIRPHRHWSDYRTELLVAVRGEMALVLFDGDGAVTQVHRLATERYGPSAVAAVEISPTTWHTVVALMPGCVLLEVKAGPFDPNQAKDLAFWAPPEDDRAAALDYRCLLKRQIDSALNK
jgi:cupin fold WbuC family metalloprotein